MKKAWVLARYRNEKPTLREKRLKQIDWEGEWRGWFLEAKIGNPSLSAKGLTPVEVRAIAKRSGEKQVGRVSFRVFKTSQAKSGSERELFWVDLNSGLNRPELKGSFGNAGEVQLQGRQKKTSKGVLTGRWFRDTRGVQVHLDLPSRSGALVMRKPVSH